MNNRTLAGELEIDLIQVMKDLLLQWKSIIIMMLIFGILTPSMMYVRDMKNYNATIEANQKLREKVTPTGETVSDDEDIYEDLTDAERIAIENAIIQKETLDNKQEYIDNSLLMKIDPLETHSLTMEYYINTPDGTTLRAVGNRYISSFRDEEFLDKAAEIFDTKSEYVGELVSAYFGDGPASSLSTGDVLIISVYIPEGVDKADLEKLISDHVSRVSSKTNSDIGDHSLKLISSDDKTYVNRSLMDTQNAEQGALIAAESTLASTVAAFSDAQMQIYDAKTSGDEDVKAVEDKEKPESIEPEKPSFSKKYAVLGLLIGLVIYGGLYLLLLILVPVIRTGLELSDMLGIKSFGCQHSDPKRFGFFCDKLVFNLLYQKDKSTDELMKDTAEGISVFSKYYEVPEVTLVSCDADSKAAIGQLVEKLSAQGVTAKHMDLWDGEKITDLVEENMSGSDNYIICMMPRATTIAHVDRILSVADEFEKKVIGTVAM